MSRILKWIWSAKRRLVEGIFHPPTIQKKNKIRNGNENEFRNEIKNEKWNKNGIEKGNGNENKFRNGHENENGNGFGNGKNNTNKNIKHTKIII